MINRCRPTAEGDSRRELANALARGGRRSVQGRRASSNFLSRETLKVRRRCGLSPWLCQIRATL